MTAVAGEAALALVQARERLLEVVARQLQCPIDEVPETLDARLRTSAPKADHDVTPVPRLADFRARVQALDDGTSSLVAVVDLPPESLRETALAFAEEINGVVCLLAKKAGRAQLVVTVSRMKTPQFDAKAILERIAPFVNGRGGGRRHLAQGGGDNPAGIEAITREFRRAASGAPRQGRDPEREQYRSPLSTTSIR